MDKIKIEKGIPIPHRNYKYPFPDMDVGDSFVIPLSCRDSISNCMNSAAKKSGKKFASRTVSETELRVCGASMRTAAILAAAVSLFAPRARAQAIDADRLIAAICAVEGGCWGLTMGGAANVQAPTWRDHSALPFEFSRYSGYALPIYKLHVEWLIKTLPAYGIKVTPENVAGAWRLGCAGLAAATKARKVPDYGKRVANLYAN